MFVVILLAFFLWGFWFVCFAARSTEDQLKPFTEDWSEDDVSTWLCAQELEDLAGVFKMNNIDGKELLNLTKDSLADDLKIGKISGRLCLCIGQYMSY